MQIRYRISTKELCSQIGLSPVSIWRKSKSEKTFPKPIYIGAKKLWYQDEVTVWIEANERTSPAFNNLSVECQDDRNE
ncbi:MAG: AlpA family phage regulatory protein [Methylomarinum sp.]|nr:AlpA family phage regulatory protein [Methylomarinum sp.]